MQQKIVIVDYGMGNLNSVAKKIKRLNLIPVVTSDPDEILNADKIILPGVGHFKKAMENLVEMNLLEALNTAVLIKKKPILGICLGMQLMANKSEEGDVEGLGWVDAEVVKFNVTDSLKFKIPHMGWNQITHSKKSTLMQDITELEEFYFVHSYYMKLNNKADELNQTEYESVFTSAIEKGNIFGVQYHPEKSHDQGEQLLKNFINI